MVYSGKKPLLISVSIISVVILFVFLNIFLKPDLIIDSFCEVFPKEKWVLTYGTNGQVISNVVNYENGHTVQYSLNQFERGEYVTLKFFFDNKEGKLVNKGDTIISMKSTDVEDRFLTAQAELDLAKATLKSQSTGQKESLIKEAKDRMIYTDERIKEQKILSDRFREQYEKGASALQEYETQKWMLDLLQIEKEIYKAQLENLSTGLKDEDLKIVESQIASLESRLVFLKDRKSNLTIVSPVSGCVVNTYSPDTLLTVVDDKEVILHTAVKVEDLYLLNIGQTINLNFRDLENEYSGSIVTISREVKPFNGEQIVFVSVKLNNEDGVLIPGMVKESSLRVKEISLLEYIYRFFST